MHMLDQQVLCAAHAQKGKAKAQSVGLSLAAHALAEVRDHSETAYADTEEGALAVEMEVTTFLLELFNSHSRAWEAMEVCTSHANTGAQLMAHAMTIRAVVVVYFESVSCTLKS